jgi:hypothetical protein
MKKYLIAAVAILISTAAYATCTTHSYFVNGKVVLCTTCCNGGHCTTNCI